MCSGVYLFCTNPNHTAQHRTAHRISALCFSISFVTEALTTHKHSRTLGKPSAEHSTKTGPHCRGQYSRHRLRSRGLAQSTPRAPSATASGCLASLPRTDRARWPAHMIPLAHDAHVQRWHLFLVEQHHEAQYDVQHAIRFGQPAEHAAWVGGAEQHSTSRPQLPNTALAASVAALLQLLSPPSSLQRSQFADIL